MLLEQPGTSNTVQCSIGLKCSWTNHLQQIQRSAVLGLNSAGQPTTAVIEQCSMGLLHQLVQPATQQVHTGLCSVGLLTIGSVCHNLKSGKFIQKFITGLSTAATTGTKYSTYIQFLRRLDELAVTGINRLSMLFDFQQH